MARTKKQSIHYVDNKKFAEALVEHRNRVFAYHEKIQYLLSIYEDIKDKSPRTIIELDYYVSTYLYFIALLDAKPRVSNYIGECLYKIARGFQTTPRHINRTYPEDLCSNAVENCLKYITNFDPEKSTNPFSYFTQIVHFSFLRTVYSENKQRDIESRIITEAEFSTLFNGNGSLEPEIMQSLKEQTELRSRSLSRMDERV